MAERRHFTLIVVGENPNELISKFGPFKVEPYPVYLYEDREKYYNKIITAYEALLKKNNLSDYDKDLVIEELRYLHSIDAEDYYLDISEEYELDDETGNAMSDINPLKKYDTCRISTGLLSLPLIDKNGNEVFSALKKDIDWDKIHLSDGQSYEIAWDTVMEGKIPVTDQEKLIYDNMKNRTAYFRAYENRENYVLCNTAFWAYAIINKEGWNELEKDMNQFEWTKNFFDHFIKPLSDDERINIFECTRN